MDSSEKLLLNILPDIGRNIIELIVGVVYHTNSEDLLTYEIKSTFEGRRNGKGGMCSGL